MNPKVYFFGHFQVNPKAYLEALDKFAKPGDVCSVFTPDDSHFEIISAGFNKISSITGVGISDDGLT